MNKFLTCIGLTVVLSSLSAVALAGPQHGHSIHKAVESVQPHKPTKSHLAKQPITGKKGLLSKQGSSASVHPQIINMHALIATVVGRPK